jgi:hypothetical protein
MLLDKLLSFIKYGVNHGINDTNLSMFRVLVGHMLFWFHQVHSKKSTALYRVLGDFVRVFGIDINALFVSNFF